LEPAPASRFRGANPHRSSSYTHWALLGPLRSWRTIIGVVDDLGLKSLTPSGDSPIFQKAVHVQVCEQGTNYSALRCSAGALLPSTHPPTAALIPLVNRALQPHLDQTQHIPIDNSAGDTLHQFAVWNRVKILGQISVHHLGIACTQ